MDKVYVKGQKLFITTEEATYDGTFHSMDAGKTRLTVKDVVKHPSEESFDGLYHFYKDEIISVQIMDPLSSAWMTPGTEMVSSKLSSIMRGCHTNMCNRFAPRSLGECELPKNLYDYYLNLLKKFLIIDDVGSLFELAVQEIKKQTLIGVSIEGAQLGRKGKLSWVSICCPFKTDDAEDDDEAGLIYLDPNHKHKVPSRVTVYLFDLALMGSAAISKGLGEILSGKDSPTKVMFDCRLPSDCLYHQFEVKLENVVDLQVAQVITFRPKIRPPDGDKEGSLIFTRSLYQCLSIGLGLPANLLYQPQIDDGNLQRHCEIWYQRPITSLMAKAAAYQSIYLLNMWARFRFLESYEIFLIGVQIYLSCVRDANDDKAFAFTSYYNRVPDEFVPYLIKYHDKQMVNKKKYGRASQSKQQSMGKVAQM